METSDESDKDKDAISVPSHYKKYTIQDRWLVIEQPKRERQPGKSYDGPEDAKKIDLAQQFEELLTAQGVQGCQRLERIWPKICQHTIPLKPNAKPSRQPPYTSKRTCVKKIKEEIDKLKEA